MDSISCSVHWEYIICSGWSIYAYLKNTLLFVLCVGADSGLEYTVDGKRLWARVVTHFVVSVETQLMTLKNHIKLLPSTFDPANEKSRYSEATNKKKIALSILYVCLIIITIKSRQCVCPSITECQRKWWHSMLYWSCKLCLGLLTCAFISLGKGTVATFLTTDWLGHVFKGGVIMYLCNLCTYVYPYWYLHCIKH